MANYDLTYEGSRVQSILDTGDELRDAGYIFRGEATPSTVPGTPTERVAYIGGPGTYTNFGSSITVGAGCVCIFKYTGSAWSNQVINTGLDSAVNTLQSAITAINNNIGNGYVYAGVATPSTSPVTGKVFYLAVQAGTYINFGNAVVTAGLNVLKYNGSAWSVDQVIAIDAEPTQGSANLVKSGGVLNSIIQNGPAFDLSAYNAQGGVLATYADLSAALTALNALPADFKKGGMSMKFVLSSDNNYVQFRYMLDDATNVSEFTNTDNWAVCDDGVYVESPDYICVWTDKDKKIAIAVEKDGNVKFGAGVPKQIIDYINEKIAELSLDEYEDIVAFLGSLIEGDKTLQQLLDEKVDKEEGRSLVDEDVANSVHYDECPDFIDVETDKDKKILEAHEKDGTKVIYTDIKIKGNVATPASKVMSDDNPDFMSVELDGAGHILEDRRDDGTKEFRTDVELHGKTTIKNAKVEDFEVDNDAVHIENDESPDYIEVEFDGQKKILSGRRKTDGKKIETIGFETPELSVNSTKIKTVKDPDKRLSLCLDSERKIISYRDKDGVLHENIGLVTPNVVTNTLTMGAQGLTDFGNALKNNGFTLKEVNDFSDIEALELPEPKHYGLLNLIIPALPVNDDDVSEGYAEYYDLYGNYFKKSCEISPQGQTSKTFAKTGGKGNYTLDITDGSEIKFGNWVPQDSFHLKGCAKDCTRGLLATSYKFAYDIMNFLDAKPNRVLMDESAITTTAATGDRFTDWPSDARCLPDGFPVEVYINGEYWGLYALQLKKHRKNYSMDKKDYKSFILDADGFAGFWGGTIPWTTFEIRNPKDLYCMDGSKYDGDNPKELIDNTSVNYDASNSKHVGSAKTKQIVESFPTKYLEVKSYIDNNDLATAKEKFEEYFDVNACIFVYIYNCLVRNSDSINKNTLWATWNDGKIAPMLWDLDCVYGQEWLGNFAYAPSAFMWTGIYATSAWPLAELWALYQTEIKAAYASLRSEGLISIERWHDVMFKQWIERIGEEAFNRDIKKWNETPSYRENYTNTEYWKEIGFISGAGSYNVWDNNTSYAIGDRCVIKMHSQSYYHMVYEAVKVSTNVCPVTKFYTHFPIVGGFYDSPKRMEKWMASQIGLCDSVMNYSE